jgi:hypothetical protein
VAHAVRPYAEVEAANGRVQRCLLGQSRRFPEVTGVGMAKSGGQFVVRVAVDHLTDELRGAIEAAVAPDSVTLVIRGRARRF